MIKYLFIIIFAFPHLGHAKVFDYKKSTVATYLRGGFGLNNLQKYAYQPGFPTSVTFADSDGVNQTYSAEFGFSFITGKLCTRLGVELLYPQLTSGLSGKNASGTQLLSITSQVYSLVPKIDFEFAFKETPTSKVYGGIGAGYAMTTIKNSVTMTAAGSAAFPGVTDYIEEGSGSGYLGEVFFGFEWAFFDNVGFSLDAGYRYLINSSYNSNRNTTTVSKTETTGAQIMNADNTARTTSLSGPFAAGTFRIYFR